jgi:hypothetical protein
MPTKPRTAREVEAREEVSDEAAKERDVVEDELRHVRVSKRAHEHLLLGHLGKLALEGARHDEHGLERCRKGIGAVTGRQRCESLLGARTTHAEVVVVLLRELLLCEAVERRHLLCEDARGLKSHERRKA